MLNFPALDVDQASGSDHRGFLGGSDTQRKRDEEERAWQLCRQYIDRGVSGVFFAPLEGSSDSHDINQRIARSLDEAKTWLSGEIATWKRITSEVKVESAE